MINIIEKFMDKNDIKYVLEILNDAISEKNWDGIFEIKEILLEFLDDDDLEHKE